MRSQLVAMATTGLLCALGATAQAEIIQFDFEGTTTNALGTDGSSSDISDYMSEVYGETVTVTDARSNPSSSRSDWGSTGDSYQNDGGFIQATGGSDFEIVFGDCGVTAVRFTGFIDDATIGRDFNFSAYGPGYDNGTFTIPFLGTFNHSSEVPNSNALVETASWEADEENSDGLNEDVSFDSGWIYFDSAVTMLVFHDSGSYDVAIDDLQVRTVPLPAAAWMGLMMLGGLGLARRRRKNTA